MCRKQEAEVRMELFLSLFLGIIAISVVYHWNRRRQAALTEVTSLSIIHLVFPGRKVPKNGGF
jgi:hypothetical protein